MNPEPAEQNSLTGGEGYETLLEMFCASTNEVPDLADRKLVSRAADDLIDRISYAAPWRISIGRSSGR